MKLLVPHSVVSGAATFCLFWILLDSVFLWDGRGGAVRCVGVFLIPIFSVWFLRSVGIGIKVKHLLAVGVIAAICSLVLIVGSVLVAYGNYGGEVDGDYFLRLGSALVPIAVSCFLVTIVLGGIRGSERHKVPIEVSIFFLLAVVLGLFLFSEWIGKLP